MEVGIKQAKSCLSKLVTLAHKGDRIFLTNHGKRVLELVPVKETANHPPTRGLGMCEEVKLPPGFGSKKQRHASTQEILKEMGLA